MSDLQINVVKNGFIVLPSPGYRYECVGEQYIFVDADSMCEWIREYYSAKEEV